MIIMMIIIMMVYYAPLVRAASTSWGTGRHGAQLEYGRGPPSSRRNPSHGPSWTRPSPSLPGLGPGRKSLALRRTPAGPGRRYDSDSVAGGFQVCGLTRRPPASTCMRTDHDVVVLIDCRWCRLRASQCVDAGPGAPGLSAPCPTLSLDSRKRASARFTQERACESQSGALPDPP
jgi:hypothetical protein